MQSFYFIHAKNSISIVHLRYERAEIDLSHKAESFKLYVRSAQVKFVSA